MQKVWFERHPGLYSEEFEYFNFYGIYFNDILQAANFLKHIKYESDTQYEGWMERGIRCLKDVACAYNSDRLDCHWISFQT